MNVAKNTLLIDGLYVFDTKSADLGMRKSGMQILVPLLTSQQWSLGE